MSDTQGIRPYALCVRRAARCDQMGMGIIPGKRANCSAQRGDYIGSEALGTESSVACVCNMLMHDS
eukprot:COSAG02_NODE_29969_length_559_cov_1.663043_1_plen_65_part_10